MMAKILNKWIQGFNRYLKLQKQFSNEISSLVMLKTIISSIGVAIIALLIPVLIGVNLIVFVSLRYYLLLYFMILGLIFIEVYYLQFKKWIVVFDEKIQKLNLKFMFLVERRMIQIIFFIIFGLIILQLGV
jgi:hypothetical protein